MYAASGSGGASAAAAIVFAVFAVIGVIFWAVPVIVAVTRKVPNIGSVVIIDVFLGWTLIGWVIALAMACRSRPQPLPQPGVRLP